MIKLSQLPGVKTFKTMNEVFKHISNEVSKKHTEFFIKHQKNNLRIKR